MGESVSANMRTSIEEVRQTELIDATIRTISELGFDRTRIRDIARAAGASTGSVHYYFANKDELLRAAVVDCDERFGPESADALVRCSRCGGKAGTSFHPCFPDDPAAGQDYYVFIDFWQQAALCGPSRVVRQGKCGLADELAQVLQDGATQCRALTSGLCPGRSDGTCGND